MTEWVDTEMKVYGDREDLEIFKDEVSENDNHEEWRNSVFSFNKIIPMPEDVAEYDKLGLCSDRIQWEIEHWGVKVGERYAFVDDRNTYLAYNFDNPWGPPIPIFNALFKRYPKLSFHIITRDLDYEIDFELKTNKGKIITLHGAELVDAANCEPPKPSEPYEPMDIKCVEVIKMKDGKKVSSTILYPSA